MKSLGIDKILQNPNLRSSLKDAINIVVKKITPPTEFNGGDFKVELKTFFENIEETSNALVLLGNSGGDEIINLDIMKKFINDAPDAILYPIYLVLGDTGLIDKIKTQLAEIPESLVIVDTIMSQNIDPSTNIDVDTTLSRNLNIELDVCSIYKENKILWKRSNYGLKGAGYGIQLLGMIVAAVGKQQNSNVEGGAAAGAAASVGGTFKPTEAIGDVIKGLGTVIVSVSGVISTKIVTCDQSLALATYFEKLNVKIDKKDEEIKKIKGLLNEIIRLQSTPFGLRSKI